MFLKSLTLKGFKSFADTTTLEFEPGVTVVVGPNGSGKSNVVDAVAWVLGAQGPRALRSSKMEDVIFAGTPKRAALGRAEVSLTIDNSAGLLPIEFSEVTITRTLFRTGESEYAINRVPCRLLDVQDLLSDTGVGRQQHVIVSQGNLDAILTSRPEERRLIIEEAAGVLKYRRRKERSERRLEATEASLLRLQDLLREVRRQLRPLEKQAEAARRHDGLAAELGALRRHLAGRDLVAVQARLTSAAERGAELARAESEVRSALAAFDAEVIAGEAELSARRRKGEELDLAEVVSRAERIRARAAGAVALLDQRRRSLERELVATLDEDVIASLESESASLAAQLEAVATEAAGLGPQRAEVAQAEEHLAAETDAVEAQWGAEGRAPADPAAEARGELGARRVAIDRARAEQRRLESRAAAAAGRRDRLAEESMRLRSEAEEVDARAAGLNAAAEEAAAAATEADAALAAAEGRRRTADAALHHWQARAEALAQALDQARARAGAERLASVTGVVGTLLELVQVDEGWEAAFEAAAGEALAAVVVDSGEAAGRALEELRRGGDAGAVLSLGGGVPAPAAPPPPGVAAVRGAVRSRLPAVNALLDRLLAPAVHVPDFATAVDLAGRRPDLVVVTSEGDRFAGGLWRTGVGGTGATGAALDEAQEKAAAARAHAARAAADAAEARRTLEERAAAAARREGERAAAEARRRTLSDATARVDVELTDAAGEADAAERQKAEAAERLAAESARVDELAVLLPALEAEAAEAAERVLAARAARDRLVERAAAVAGMRRELEVRAAGLEERRQLLERRRDDVDARLANLGSQRATAAARRQRLEREVMAVTALATLAAGLEPALAGALDRLRAARRAEAAATAEASERLDGFRRQRAAAERQLAETLERAGRAELEGAEARVRLDALTELIRRELDCEPDAVLDAPCPELPPGTSAPSRRTELERELRLMGPVNPLALEEYQALQERQEFLEAQLEDVRSARRELAKVIRAVDAEIVEVFRAAYADVADNFEKLFATLFPGGQGRLRLTDPDRLLETGIELEARPSGKNVRRLSLLSGGERSLTAMAFLFAVFRSRPSPFYLMDEVEAALDDVNLHRFLDLVREFRSEAQLLIVSHQKRTMEAADCLYGVTMPPGGSSQVVSERIAATA